MGEEKQNIYQKLLEIQRELKCDKSQFNKFGGYAYRSKEDILEAVKPLAHERGCVVVVSDHIEELRNGWVYIESTASLRDGSYTAGNFVHAMGYAREPEAKKGMDASQITGTAASYAGKRALGNLFAIDDTKDADAIEPSDSPKKEHSEADIELWNAVKEFAKRYDKDPQSVAESVKRRDDYDGTDESKLRIAEELRQA